MLKIESGETRDRFSDYLKVNPKVILSKTSLKLLLDSL